MRSHGFRQFCEMYPHIPPSGAGPAPMATTPSGERRPPSGARRVLSLSCLLWIKIPTRGLSRRRPRRRAQPPGQSPRKTATRGNNPLRSRSISIGLPLPSPDGKKYRTRGVGRLKQHFFGLYCRFHWVFVSPASNGMSCALKASSPALGFDVLIIPIYKTRFWK